MQLGGCWFCGYCFRGNNQIWGTVPPGIRVMRLLHDEMPGKDSLDHWHDGRDS
jgi:hypothetical protein